MCGIIGFSGNSDAKDILIKGLYALEYRGYDSAGISLEIKDDFYTVKCSGRVSELEKLTQLNKVYSSCGIGHTRWATHGEPTIANAHPHESNNCVLVHNGIIENYLELKNMLINNGYTFKSDTDTECIAHLVDNEFVLLSDPIQAILSAMKKLKGSFAVAVMFKGYNNKIWGFKRDNPLIAVLSDNGTYLASDIPALLPYSKDIIRPCDNEILCLDGKSITLFDDNGKQILPKIDRISWNVSTAQKDGYEHFMLKEIYEQPKAIIRAVSQIINNSLPDLSEYGDLQEILSDVDSVSIVACGSATHAGLVGKFLIESLSNIPVFITTASEYRYCPTVTTGNTLTIAISQSGETADTLAAVRIAKSKGFKTLGIINSVGSAIARESDYVLYTNAGPEIAVATTKGYTTQLAVLAVLAVSIGLSKSALSVEEGKRICDCLTTDIIDAIKNVISRREEIKEIAKLIYQDEDLYFIGRGIDSSACLECSLKLKEISYIHSEAYAAGELKHGTISLIEENIPVIALCCDKTYYDKMIGNIREVKSRGAKVIFVCSEQFLTPEAYCRYVFKIPNVFSLLSPLVSVVFSQLLAYETALIRGCDIDHPRNLAKSVTVE